MVRNLIAGTVGGFVFFIWGMASWMIFPIHVPTMNGMPAEASVTEALKAQALETGVYVAPWSDNEEDWTNPESDWAKLHIAGPTYTVIYQEDGCVPMDPKVYAGGLLIDIVGGILAAVMLCAALPTCRKYWQRVLFVTGFGVFVAIIAHVGYWNWMRFPTDWTIAFVIDCVVGWALAGLAIAAMVKPRDAATPASEAA